MRVAVKKTFCVLLILLLAALLAGCSSIRGGYTGTYGMVKLPTGEVVMGEVSSYSPVSGAIYVVIGNNEYRTSEVNVVITRSLDHEELHP